MTTDSSVVSPGPFYVLDQGGSTVGIMSPQWPSAGLAKVYLCNPKTRKRTPEFAANVRLFQESWALLHKLKQLCEAESRMPGNNPISGLCDEAREIISRVEGVTWPTP